MKVVVSGYVGKRITGIGRNIISLLANTTRENQYVVYANKDFVNNFQGIGPNVAVREYKISKDNSIGNLLWTTFVFPIKVAKEKADVALIPNFTLLLFKSRPTAVIMHDLIEFNIPNKFTKLKMFYRTRLADPITAHRADRIMTVSNNSKRDIVNYLHIPESKIDVVYNGIDFSLFKRMNDTQSRSIIVRKGWPEKFILYAGTIDHPGKNSYSVVKAFELMCEEGYEGSLVLAGMPGTGYNTVLEAVKNSPVNQRITLTGYVDDSELVALYSRCDAFCFPSLYEGFGMPPLEALACGAKVVTSNSSSLPEVVGRCGCVVDALDITSIARTVSESITATRDENEVLKHLENFSWSNLSADFERFLRVTAEN